MAPFAAWMVFVLMGLGGLQWYGESLRFPSVPPIGRRFLIRGQREPGCEDLIAQTEAGSLHAQDVPSLFRCVLVDPATTPKDMHEVNDESDQTAGSPSPTSLFRRMKERNVHVIHPSDLREMPVHNVEISASLSMMSYFSRSKLESDSRYSVRAVMSDQAAGFPIEVQGDTTFTTDAYIWLSKSTRTAYVSFPGTRTFEDLGHDLDTRSVPLDPTRPADVLVHAGFRNKYFSVHEMLADVLEIHESMFDTLVTTGHSLGGALATIAAPMLSETFPTKKIECLTFGSPRVGNSAFVSWFQSRVPIHWRLVNAKDPVPWMPFSGRFHHVSDAVSMTARSELTRVPDAPIDKRYRWAFEDLDLSQIATDHDLDTYISRVNYYLNN